MNLYNKVVTITFALLAMTICCSCSDSSSSVDSTDDSIAVSLPSITEIGYESAMASAVITNPSSLSLSRKGFCYSTDENPTISSNTAVMNSAGSTISCALSNLTQATTYYVRAFVMPVNAEPIYSEMVSFSTVVKPADDLLADYVPPTYVDNYVNIASWSNRASWNLANVHDPTVVLADDGYYYMYQTDASYGNAHTSGGHFHGRRSKDLVNWEYLGGTMKDLPEWIIPKLNEIRTAMGLETVNPNKNDFGYWAPCVRKVKDGLYRMYYSIVCPGYLDASTTSWGERAFIGVMENSNPANNDAWVDKGYVITNASDLNLNFYVSPTAWESCYYRYNAIDPTYIITPSQEHWLIYGSWHSGFAALQVDAETGKPTAVLPNPWGTMADISPYGKLVATRKASSRWQASEGPEVVYNSETGYYYMFVAYDGLDIPYNTRVCRSKNVDGPYLGIDGKNISETGGDIFPVVTHPYKFNDSYGWVGISHCAVFDDAEGNWFFASQGRLPANVDGNAYSNAIMLGQIRSIRWTDDGWPVVMPERYGAVPKVAITEDDLVGDWEHIDMSYSYGKQKTSSTMTLSADHVITDGTWKNGSWSYDAEKQILTANGVKLYLQREVDWEANPRHLTIVYVGLNNTKTYWGKKVK